MKSITIRTRLIWATSGWKTTHMARLARMSSVSRRKLGSASARKYIGGLSAEAVADVLAKAVGIWGSMAEYLHSAGEHLEDLGIHDKQLWLLQEMVAERIEAANMGAGH